MTKFQKQMLTIAAAGALGAVTALPAMAFENEFNGTFAVKTYLSNFENGSGAASLSRRDTLRTNNFTDQRTRLNYTAKASDDLKLVVQLEMNTLWGNSGANGASAAGAASPGATNTAGVGGGIDTDGINVATRHAYLDFNMGKSLNVKLGQQPYQDTFKGLYAGSIDLPMARVAYKQGGYTLGLGYSRFNDNQVGKGLGIDTFKGDRAADLYFMENTYAFSKDTKLGMSYYLNVDNTLDATFKEKKINTFGLFGQTKIGSLDLSGFAAMQAGYQKNVVGVSSTNYHGWAANVAAKMKAGNGTARTAFLFTSGNNKTNGHNGGWQTLSNAGTDATAAQNSYVEGGMMLMARNPSQGGTNNDGYIRKPVTNIALLTMGYDANLTEKTYLNGNVGFAWLPSSDNRDGITSVSAVKNGSDFMGTEMNIEAGYKLYKNLTLKAQAAYVVLGGAYKNTAFKNDGITVADPANPWTMRLGAHYSF